ncbi:TraB/GumN family protein [Sphingomonas sp. BGYR3]|uniref:TraB/GumN family protein n=1 Tax=Sphingomonas sp. BGYR3 TaxID=2975483 RepID=UPI0021A8A0A2|nr:TraB/GumN family protein [Sphingomonas sp. BGYR3]MDG5487959.1 TraB/GumN family protein [Sphingomonas sp. BGYR3]
MPLPKLFLLFAAFALAGPAVQVPQRDVDPPVWVVRDADTTIYLFGTVHWLKPELAWFNDEVAAAFNASDEVVMELAPGAQAAARGDFQRLSTLPDGTPALPDRLPPGYADKLRAALRRVGYPETAFDRTAPWLAATSLSVLPLRELGYDEALGVERVLVRAAERAGKPVGGLEQPTDQYAIFAGLSEADQIAMLTRILDNQATVHQGTERAVAAWSSADTADMAAVLAEDQAKSPRALTDPLVTARNRRWAEWVRARMNRPGIVFMAVGSGHLAGPGSVQAELERSGLKVDRLRP